MEITIDSKFKPWCDCVSGLAKWYYMQIQHKFGIMVVNQKKSCMRALMLARLFNQKFIKMELKSTNWVKKICLTTTLYTTDNVYHINLIWVWEWSISRVIENVFLQPSGHNVSTTFKINFVPKMFYNCSCIAHISGSHHDCCVSTCGIFHFKILLANVCVD